MWTEQGHEYSIHQLLDELKLACNKVLALWEAHKQMRAEGLMLVLADASCFNGKSVQG